MLSADDCSAYFNVPAQEGGHYIAKLMSEFGIIVNLHNCNDPYVKSYIGNFVEQVCIVLVLLCCKLHKQFVFFVLIMADYFALIHILLVGYREYPSIVDFI